MIIYPPLEQHIEQEIMSTTLLSSISNIIFLRTGTFRPLLIEWNNRDKSIRSSASYPLFKKSILQFIRPIPSRNFNCHKPIGIKLITRHRLGLSQLRDEKSKHNYFDCLNPICCCGKDIETNSFIVQFFQMEDQFFSTTFETLMKIV